MHRIVKYATRFMLAATMAIASQGALAQTYDCPASASWVSAPNPPQEVPLGANADFCQFYQFSWQWFLQLVSPSANPSIRNFQVAANFPLLEGDIDGVIQNSCDSDAPPTRMFVRTLKAVDAKGQFVLPERIDQAGSGPIYDQNGNVVFYDVRFSKNLCSIGKIQSQSNFPSGTTEIKSAWRIITDQQKANYFWMTANVDGVPGDETLGLIGFHLVRATALHPEFVWSTFEHKDNVPDCDSPQAPPAAGWSFTSAACASQLANLFAGPYSVANPGNCVFNVGPASGGLTGTPTQICRQFADATASTDLKASKNVGAINDLNDQLVGPSGILTQLPASNPMSVWKNYVNIGAIWESDTTQPSSNIGNQRGSMRLANSVLETTFQGGFSAGQPFSSNCFGCHNYSTSASNTLPSSDLSHIFDDIMGGQCNNASDVNAGPIFSNAQAQTVCPQTCANVGGWNGQWTTTQPGVMSVCGCCGVPGGGH